MFRNTTSHSIWILTVLASFFVSCNPKASYKPPLLPVKLVLDRHGNVSVVGELSFATPVGQFSIGAEYSVKREADALLVIIRDRRRPPKGFDTIFRITSGKDEFVAVVNGRTTVQVVERQVLLDVSDGSVETIEFRKARDPIPVSDGSFWQPWPLGYEPFALTTWAYDDSTMDRWYGIGFVWFVIRLAGSIVLLVADLLIILILGIGVVLHSTVGITVRNIYFGLLAIFTLILIIAAIDP